MDRRFICEDCRTKWFVPSSKPDSDYLTECAACGGALVPFRPESEENDLFYGGGGNEN